MHYYRDWQFFSSGSAEDRAHGSCVVNHDTQHFLVEYTAPISYIKYNWLASVASYFNFLLTGVAGWAIAMQLLLRNGVGSTITKQ